MACASLATSDGDQIAILPAILRIQCTLQGRDLDARLRDLVELSEVFGPAEELALTAPSSVDGGNDEVLVRCIQDAGLGDDRIVLHFLMTAVEPFLVEYGVFVDDVAQELGLR